MASLRLSIDARGATAGARRFDEASQVIVRRARAIVVASGNIERAMDSLTKSFTKNTTAFNKAFPDVAKTRLDAVTQGVRTLRDELLNLPSNVNTASQATRAYGDTLPYLRLGLQTVTTANQNFRASLRGTNGIAQETADRINQAARAARNYSTATSFFSRGGNGVVGNARQLLGGVTLATGAALIAKGTISNISDFSDELAKIRGITQASEEELGRLTTAARELGDSSVFGATKAAQGLLELVKAGLSAREAITALPAVLEFSRVGAIDLGEAADVTTGIMRQFDLQSDQTSRIVNVLGFTASSTRTDVAKLASSFKYAGPIASAFGDDLETTSAALGILSQSGIEASLAGTSLRTILLGLSKPTAEARQRIKELGIDIRDLNPATHDIVQIFERFAQAQLDATDAGIIFDRRAVGSALSLTKNIDQVKALTEANRQNTEFSKRAAAEIDASLGSSFKKLGSAAEGASIHVGNAGLGKALQETVDTVTGALLIFANEEDLITKNARSARLLADSFELLTYAVVGFVAVKVVSYLASIEFGLIALESALFRLAYAIAANPIGALVVALGIAATAVFAFSESLDSNHDALVKEQAQLRKTASAIDEYVDAQERLNNSKKTKVVSDQVEALDQQLAALKQLKLDASAGHAIDNTKLDLVFPGLAEKVATQEKLIDDIKNEQRELEQLARPDNISFGDTSNQIDALIKDIETKQAALRVVQEQIVKAGGVSKIGALGIDNGTARNTVTLVELINSKIESLIETRGKLAQKAVKRDHTLLDIPDDGELKRLQKADDAYKKYIDDLFADRELIGKSDLDQAITIEARKALEAATKAGDLFSSVGLAKFSIVTAEITDQETRKAAIKSEDELKKKRKEGTQTLEEQVQALRDELVTLQASEQQRYAVEQRLKAEETARKSGITLTKEYIATLDQVANAVDREREKIKLREDAEKQLKRDQEQAEKDRVKAEEDAFKDLVRIAEARVKEQERQAKASADATRQAEDLVAQLEAEAYTINLTNVEREKALSLKQLDDIATKGEIKNLEQLKTRTKQAIDSADKALKIRSFADDIAGAFGNAFDTIFDSASSLGDKLVSLFRDISKQIFSNLFTKPLAAGISNLIQNSVQGSSFFGNLFGSAPAAAGGQAVTYQASTGLFAKGATFRGNQQTTPSIAQMFAKGGITYVGEPSKTSTVRNFAKGAAFTQSIVPMANGRVVYGREDFPLADGRTGRRGEAGAEAVMPLARAADGSLGVRNHGGSAPTVIHRTTTIKMTVNAKDANSFRNSERQITSRLKRKVNG